jgi:hypothetical protein
MYCFVIFFWVEDVVGLEANFLPASARLSPTVNLNQEVKFQV